MNIAAFLVNGIVSVAVCFLVTVGSFVLLGKLALKLGWYKEKKRIRIPRSYL